MEQNFGKNVALIAAFDAFLSNAMARAQEKITTQRLHRDDESF